MRSMTVAAVLATVLAVLGVQSPAAALVWYWNGPFSTLPQCEQFRAESAASGMFVQSCVYRDFADNNWDGWYYKHAQEF